MLFSLPRRRAALIFVALLFGLPLLQPTPARPEATAKPDPAAVARTRETIKMLDDVHKGYVVHITATYVKAQEMTPAARVAKKAFKHLEDKGWGSTRLIDASGKPFNEANLPKTAFEKSAVAKIKAGQAYVDEVGTKAGKPVLRAATVVPVVMAQCINCHTGTKEGDVLGAIVYELPIR